MSLILASCRAFSYLLALVSHKKKIASFLGVKPKDVSMLYREIENSDFMREILNNSGLKRGLFNLGMSNILRAPSLYVVTRVFQPKVMVETGVADAFSSSFILYALSRNNKGRLYSIDLPNQEGQVLREGRFTGWLVPQSFKERWELIIGSSREKLPPLLNELEVIDCFYHDSEHSYENMMFEFMTVNKHLSQNGIIISDDITDNRAFADFSGSVNCNSVEFFKLGLIKKL